jgi:hypothetical protein
VVGQEGLVQPEELEALEQQGPLVQQERQAGRAE